MKMISKQGVLMPAQPMNPISKVRARFKNRQGISRAGQGGSFK